MNIQTKLTNLVREIGVPAHVQGYKYLQDAIEIALAKPEVMYKSVTKVLYPSIATVNGTTPERVERSMRHAIELAWKNGSKDLITKIFVVVPEHVTVSQFVATLADTLAKGMY